MLKTKTNEDKVDTLLAKSLVPIIDLAHCGKLFKKPSPSVLVCAYHLVWLLLN